MSCINIIGNTDTKNQYDWDFSYGNISLELLVQETNSTVNASAM